MKKVDEIFDGDRIKTNIFNNSNVLYHKHVSYLTLAGLGVQWQSYDNNEKLYDGIVTERKTGVNCAKKVDGLIQQILEILEKYSRLEKHF